MKSIFDQSQAKNGFVALSTVLILSALVIAFGTTIAMLAIGEAQSALAATKGEDTLHFVEGCAEDALLKARATQAYTGGTITRPEGTCSVTLSKAGSTWTMTVTTTANTYKRTIQVIFTRDSMANKITSWRES